MKHRIEMGRGGEERRPGRQASGTVGAGNAGCRDTEDVNARTADAWNAGAGVMIQRMPELQDGGHWERWDPQERLGLGLSFICFIIINHVHTVSWTRSFFNSAHPDFN